MMLFVRAFFITIVRFIVILAVMMALGYLDVSPLPDWTLFAFAYLLHFALTYLFARWAFGRRSPRLKQTLTVFLTFLIFGTGLEVVIYFTGGGQLKDLLSHYTWQSLYLILIYAAAVWLAAYRSRRVRVKQELPEGLES